MNSSGSSVAITLISVIAWQGQVIAHQTPPQEPAAVATDAKPTPVYDEKADAKSQIAEALVKAKKNNRRVLIQWGGNWCGWCLRLHKTFTIDTEIKQKLIAEYEVVHIDTAKPAGKNIDLAKSYGAQVETKGYPYLTILDADGAVIANQDTGPLEVGDADLAAGHDPKLVLEVLTKHQAPPIDAQKILDSALARAKSEKKLVFLRETGPFCGWCRVMDTWSERAEVKPILEKTFVDLKIDSYRMTDAPAVLKRFGANESDGIPWFAFVDADGKVLADSRAAEGNVGFPQSPAEIAHFEAMLKKATGLTAAEISTLSQSLAAMKTKPAPPVVAHP